MNTTTTTNTTMTNTMFTIGFDAHSWAVYPDGQLPETYEIWAEGLTWEEAYELIG